MSAHQRSRHVLEADPAPNATRDGHEHHGAGAGHGGYSGHGDHAEMFRRRFSAASDDGS